MHSPRNPKAVWGTLIGVGVAYELYGIFGEPEGDTLSEITRELFHTSHPVGKAAFLAAYVAFSSWFVPHIVIKASGAAQRVADRRAR